MVQPLSEKISKFQTNCGSAIERYLREKGKSSANTEINYRGDFQRFIKEEFGKNINTITTEELDTVSYDMVMDYRERMYGKLANGTVNRHINTIKEIMKELKAGNLLKSDISYFSRIKKIPVQSVEIEYMPSEVVDRYIKEAGREVHYPELKQNMIKFAVDTGLRLDEVLNTELKDFAVDGDRVLLKGYGKGNKEYIDWIDIGLYNSLLETMRTGDNPKSRVFAPLNTKNVTDMMQRIKSRLGYQDRGFSFHSFKKTAVTNTYRLTGCILAAQAKGRHENLNTTRKYLKAEDFGITGMFSLRNRNYDEDLYKKAKKEDLVKSIEEMNKDFIYLLNLRLSTTIQNNIK